MMIASLMLSAVWVGSPPVVETPSEIRTVVRQAFAAPNGGGWETLQYKSVQRLRKIGAPVIRYVFDYLDAFRQPYSSHALYAGGVAVNVLSGMDSKMQKEVRAQIAKRSPLAKLSAVWSEPGYALLIELADDENLLVRNAAWHALENNDQKHRIKNVIGEILSEPYRDIAADTLALKNASLLAQMRAQDWDDAIRQLEHAKTNLSAGLSEYELIGRLFFVLKLCENLSAMPFQRYLKSGSTRVVRFALYGMAYRWDNEDQNRIASLLANKELKVLAQEALEFAGRRVPKDKEREPFGDFADPQ